MIYIEFRVRRPGIDLDVFHQIVGRRTNTWSDRFLEDRLILNLGRTWRVGPHPEYLVIYHTPGASLERISEWERIFRSGDVVDLEAQTMAVSPIEDAGCYDELVEPVAGAGGPYYAEYFDISPGADREQVKSFYEKRQRRNDDLTLHLLCDRIGKLGPDPSGVAVWGGADYGSFKAIATETDDMPSAQLELVRVGLYADIGHEIL